MAKKVLLCDVSLGLRKITRNMLEEYGYTIAGEAENGIQAVEKYNETKPDVVLMDVLMPEIDGIEALKQIKKSDKGAKVIMLSSVCKESLVTEAIQAGAKDFIVKPVVTERLLASIEKALSGV